MKLSIIIPVYRAQDTLARCLNSILQQSFTDYELILVDDGSPDNCPQLCDEYALQDQRIHVIHKENGGLSDARNAGIEKAQGDYITFIDSDDAITPNTLQLLAKELESDDTIDILEYPILERFGNPQREHLRTFHPQEYTHPVDYWLQEQAYMHTYACNKVFKRYLFHHIRFPKDKNFEDVLTTPLIIGLIPLPDKYDDTDKEHHRPKIKVTNQGCYLYYWNNKGITAQAQYKDLLNLYLGQTLSLNYTFKHIEQKEDKLDLYHASLELFMVKILNVLLDLYECSGRYETHIPLLKYVELMHQKGLITSFKLRMLILFGYKRLCRINKVMHMFYKRN